MALVTSIANMPFARGTGTLLMQSRSGAHQNKEAPPVRGFQPNGCISKLRVLLADRRHELGGNTQCRHGGCKPGERRGCRSVRLGHAGPIDGTGVGANSSQRRMDGTNEYGGNELDLRKISQLRNAAGGAAIAIVGHGNDTTRGNRNALYVLGRV